MIRALPIPAAGNHTKDQAPGTIAPSVLSCHQTTMDTFAQNLGRWAGGYLTDPVVNSTGLKGAWDFDIKMDPAAIAAKSQPDGISIFDAVDKELGLKLRHQTAPRPVLIVDSVNQKPTANVPGLEKILPPRHRPNLT